ncbi:hypothetical protein KC333_g177 [Hortaea werneckii]|nr:hypothetical protein KC333_g177 [Hortaea werneckii]
MGLSTTSVIAIVNINNLTQNGSLREDAARLADLGYLSTSWGLPRTSSQSEWNTSRHGCLERIAVWAPFYMSLARACATSILFLGRVTAGGYR